MFPNFFGKEYLQKKNKSHVSCLNSQQVQNKIMDFENEVRTEILVTVDHIGFTLCVVHPALPSNSLCPVGLLEKKTKTLQYNIISGLRSIDNSYRKLKFTPLFNTNHCIVV